MNRKTWLLGIVGFGILLLNVWLIFFNRQPSDISQMRTLLQEQENQFVLLEQTLAQLKGQVEALHEELQESDEGFQKQQRQIAEQKRELYLLERRFKAAEQLIVQQQTLIDTDQTTRHGWQEQQQFEKALLESRLAQLQSQYDSLSRSTPTYHFIDSQPATSTPNFTPQPFTNPSGTSSNVGTSAPYSSNESTVSRQEYKRHLIDYQTNRRDERVDEDRRRSEQIRQRQNETMQRIRARTER